LIHLNLDETILFSHFTQRNFNERPKARTVSSSKGAQEGADTPIGRSNRGAMTIPKAEAREKKITFPELDARGNCGGVGYLMGTGSEETDTADGSWDNMS
jgi:hypothetical protein